MTNETKQNMLIRTFKHGKTKIIYNMELRDDSKGKICYTANVYRPVLYEFCPLPRTKSFSFFYWQSQSRTVSKQRCLNVQSCKLCEKGQISVRWSEKWFVFGMHNTSMYIAVLSISCKFRKYFSTFQILSFKFILV